MAAPPSSASAGDVAPLTAQIADYACAMADRRLGARSLEIVRLGFTDAGAVLLAGLDEPVTRVMQRLVRHDPGTPAGSRMLLSRERVGAAQAALVNAVAAHAVDWDDYAYSNHPSAVLVPTLLAAGDAVGAGGARLAAAYVAGYEVWGNLMRREADHLHSKGWHPTAVLGPVAAAVAAGMIYRLTASEMRDAIALSASLAGGVMANFGTMAKPVHAGRAAHAGIQAATWAQGGLQAGSTTLESPLGLMRALSPAGRVDLKTPFPSVDDPPLIDRLALNIKKYPTVGASQRVIDSILFYLARHPVDAHQVVRAIPRISEKFAAVMPFHAPRTALEAKFSLEFVVAASLLRGKVGLAELSDAFVASEPVQALMRKVDIEITTESDPGYPNAAPFDVVRLQMADGRELRTDEIHRATGHADAPLQDGQLWTKFAQCADTARVPEALARRLFDALQNIDAWRDTEDLPALA